MNMETPAGTTTTIAVSVCPRCGTIAKSGKPSCCGRGGSWFKNCGGGGNTKYPHTWYGGIQACRARSQSKRVMDKQLNAAQQKEAGSSQGAGMDTHKAVTMATKTFTFTSVNSSARMSEDSTTSTDTSMTSPTDSSITTSMITEGFVNILEITVHINLWFIIAF